jgi:hypothetical protein
MSGSGVSAAPFGLNSRFELNGILTLGGRTRLNGNKLAGNGCAVYR